MISVLRPPQTADFRVTSRRFVSIVSGVPRSGMALTMRMLEAGGLPVLYDNKREADIDNPLGYYDYEAIKTLSSDSSWITLLKGVGVKIVYPLVYHLPTRIEYRVLLMHRNINEVLASQNAMLERSGKPVLNNEETLARMFHVDLAKFASWVRDQPNFRLLNVDYNAMVAEPEPIVAEIDRFLGGGLDINAMANTVDASLYRNRAE
jgi:hypothetical protein